MPKICLTMFNVYEVYIKGQLCNISDDPYNAIDYINWVIKDNNTLTLEDFKIVIKKKED